MRTRIVLVLSAALVLALVTTGCTLWETRVPSQDRYGAVSLDEVPVGEKALDFSLRDIYGEIKQLSDFSGNVVVLQFGSLTSAEYVANIDPLNETMETYAGKDVVFITIYSQELDPEAVETAPDEDFNARTALAGHQSYELESDGETITGTKAKLSNHIVLVDQLPGVVGGWYGYGPGRASNPAFIIDARGVIRAKNAAASIPNRACLTHPQPHRPPPRRGAVLRSSGTACAEFGGPGCR